MTSADFLAVPPGARKKIAAAGKALAYLALALVGALLATAVAKAVFGRTLLELAAGGTAPGTARAVLLLLGVVVLPTALAVTLFKEPFRVTGWAVAGAARLMAWGVATGGGLLAAIAGALWLSGTATFSLAEPAWPTALSGTALAGLLWTAQAAGEEGLHRGYAFVQACRAIAFWPAAALSSAWFMAGHLGNPGETLAGAVAAGLFGLALSYSLLRTGSLWFALGFHAAWNFTQSFVLGFPNSGGRPPASLFSAQVNGPPLVTGGSAGPEGSVLVLPAIAVLFVVIRCVGGPTARPPQLR